MSEEPEEMTSSTDPIANAEPEVETEPEEAVETEPAETAEIDGSGAGELAAEATVVDAEDTSDLDSDPDSELDAPGEEEIEVEPVRPVITDPAQLRAALEAVLFVVEAPLDVAALAAAFELTVEVVSAALLDLEQDLEARASGIELRWIAGGVRLYSRPAYAAWVETFLLDGQRSKLTQAALETLAVIAYRQPVTRARISAIRGVNVDGVSRTLLSRGLITEVGADPETGGGLYRTTDLFLEKMGLQSLEELPSLAPLLPEIDGLDIDEL